ncbi:MAG: class I SAM-dependent methyltransferase [Flavobacteriales bacterium]|jgi:ubiquinone/menaquinone biosynthesis C-methylase UbiE|nr:class I SAM-dependent methyltransferase [Flavobacteriales bacterium]MBK6882100.1 class I SAM-dependent methyltransferase [Flavobacteriales bacterium]MBK7101680.1 class I SAM-dependent methyltransferase [Flavobacteriales bacterium]MBK7620367.1 class I SAM-dependent methyltransferase [Flavobacteriales bacterium]MBK8708743.1 class I SAM-dependent methyltransferase [Flavobacteriales bacterium]
MAYTSYNAIGKEYDHTRTADPFLCERLFDLLKVGSGAEVLDVGCGTGNYSVAMSGHGLRMTGVDPSEAMLGQAGRKSDRITWVPGTAEALPFPDATFDGAMATLTTHHWVDLEQGLREVYRVLRSGARVVIFTSTPEQMQRYWLCHYFPRMMARSCAVMPTLEATTSALYSAGFRHSEQERYDIRPDLKDCFLYAAKNHPARYLDPDFRKGISSFSALSNHDELTNGLKELARDIETGTWHSIRAKVDLTGGDYLFVVATK